MPHKNFYKFKAKDNLDLGIQMGTQFARQSQKILLENLPIPEWAERKDLAKKYLDINHKYFPQYVEEMQGYAKGANIDFLDLYTMSLEDDVKKEYVGTKCSTMMTNGGKLIGHNEDWDKGSEEKNFVVHKEIGELKILELYYANTLGGNSVSINSNGLMTFMDQLVSKKIELGLPQNVIARWISETKDPEGDFEKLKNLPRSLGYNCNIVGGKGELWNIEYNSAAAILTKPKSPFVHTNHYLTELSRSEANTNKNGTFDRYKCAVEKIRPEMTAGEIEILMNDTSYGEKTSLMNERTIAKVIVNLENSVAKIWLAREPELGFVDYSLKQIFS